MWPMMILASGKLTASSSMLHGSVKIGWPQWISTGWSRSTISSISGCTDGSFGMEAVDQRVQLQAEELRMVEVLRAASSR